MSTTTVQTQHTVGSPAPLAAHSRRTTTLVLTLCCCLRRLGLDLLRSALGSNRFPTADPGGTPPPYRWPVPLPSAWKTGIRPTAANWRTGVVTGALLLLSAMAGQLGEQTVPSGIAALLWATVALAGYRGLAPSWWREARSQGGHGASDGLRGSGCWSACTS